MRRLKASRYNIVLKEENDTIVFNAKNCALVKVNDIFLELLKNPNKRAGNDYEVLSKQMMDAGFLVAADVDEVKVLEYEHNLARYDRSRLTLTILPSYECNFRCFYCFENKQNVQLDDKEIEGIKNFTLQHISGVEKLSVCWFGGEPLLNPDAIWLLSDFFIKLCKNENVEYRATMITNGSLITNKIIDKLKISHIDSVQITLDGDKECHDKRRCLKNGNGSYDLILDNIHLLTEAGIKVVCRINIDKTNYEGVMRLLSILPKENLNNFEIMFGHVLPLGGISEWSDRICYSMEEFSDVTDIYFDFMYEHGLSCPNDYPFYPRPIKNFCGACQVNSYVIHPKGDIHKCYDTVNYKIGNLFDGIAVTDVDKCNYAHWVSFNPFKDNECLNCDILPLCMGGCPHLKDILRKKFCLKWKHGIEKTIRRKYAMVKSNG